MRNTHRSKNSSRLLYACAAEMCEPRRLFALWTVPGMTAGNDVISLSRTGAGVYQAIVNGVAVSQTNVTSILVSTGAGDDTLTINSSDVPVTMIGSGGSDRLALSSVANRTLTPITGPVAFLATFVGAPASDIDSIAIRDNASGVARTFQFDEGSMTRTGTTSAVTWDSAVDVISLEHASVGAVTNVSRTRANTQLEIYGDVGNDTVNVSDFLQDLNVIQGPVLFDGLTGYDVMNVDDSASTYSGSYMIHDHERITRTGAAEIRSNDIDLLHLTANGRDSLFVALAASSPLTTALTIDAGGGDDELRMYASFRHTTTPITFNGGAGTDELTISDGDYSTNVPYSITSTSFINPIAGAFATLHNSVEVIDLTAGQMANTIDVSSVASTQSVRINGGVSTDIVRIAFVSQNLGAILGPVECVSSTADLLEIYDSNFSGTANYTLSPTAFSIGGLSTIAYTGMSTVRLELSAGVSHLNVHGVGALNSTFISANGGNDTIHIANSTRTLSSILYGLFIDGGPGTDKVVFDDSLNTAGTAYAVQATATQTLLLDSTGAVGVSTTIEAFELRNGSGADHVRIQSTLAAVATTILAGDGADLVEIAQSTGVASDVKGPLNVQLGTESDPANTQNIILHDGLATDTNGFTFTPNTVARAGMGTLTYGYDAASGAGMIVHTGSGAVRTHTYNDPTPGGSDFAGLSLMLGSAPQVMNITNADQVVSIVNPKMTDQVTVTRSTAVVGYPPVRLESSTPGGSIGLGLLHLPNYGAIAVGSINASSVGTGSPPPEPNNLTLTVNVLNTPSSNGRLELCNANLVLKAAPGAVNNIQAGLQLGRNGGTWNAPSGMTSYAVNWSLSHGGGARTLGWKVADVGGTWRSTSVAAGDVLVSYTLPGDLDLDRSVAFADLLKLAQSYGTATGATYAQGDINYDGAVNFSDLLTLAQHYGQSLLFSTTRIGRKDRVADGIV